MDMTRVQDDFSVIGQEFINLIASNIQRMVFKLLSKVGLLKHRSFREILDDLDVAWRNVSEEERRLMSNNNTWIFEEGKPTSKDGSWVHTTDDNFKIMESLGICKKNENEKCKTRNEKEKTYQKNQKIKSFDFDGVFNFLNSFLLSDKNFTLIFTEGKIAILLTLLSTIAFILGRIAESIFNYTSKISGISDADEKTEADEKSRRRGRKKGSLNKRTSNLYSALRKVADSFLSIKKACEAAISELNEYAALAAKPSKDARVSVDTSSGNNDSEQKAASKKPGVPVGTKRSAFNKDGSPRQKPGPKPGSHRKKNVSQMTSTGEEDSSTTSDTQTTSAQTPSAPNKTIGASKSPDLSDGATVDVTQQDSDAKDANTQLHPAPNKTIGASKSPDLSDGATVDATQQDSDVKDDNTQLHPASDETIGDSESSDLSGEATAYGINQENSEVKADNPQVHPTSGTIKDSESSAPSNAANSQDADGRDSGTQASLDDADSEKKTGRKSTGKKRGVPVGTRRSDVNKDGSPRQKPGPKPGSHHKKSASKTTTSENTQSSKQCATTSRDTPKTTAKKNPKSESETTGECAGYCGPFEKVAI